MPVSLDRVQPGDLITAARFNQLIDAVNHISKVQDEIDPKVEVNKPYEIALEERRKRRYSEAIVATGKTDIGQMQRIVELMIEDGATPLDLINVLDDAGVTGARIVELMKATVE